MATSDPVEESQNLVSLLRRGEAPLDIRVFAARGLLPLERADQIRALLAVMEDADPSTAALALETFLAMPPNEVAAFLRDADPSGIEIDTVARRSEDHVVLEQVIRHRNVADQTLEVLARTVIGAPQEALIVNHVRLLRQPSLIESLFENPGLTADGRRILNEMREEFFEKEIRRREAEEAREEEAVRALEAAGIAEVAALEAEAAGEAEPEAGEKPTPEDLVTEGAIFQRIAIMTVSEKIKLAYSGGKEERRILIGDANRLVGLAVLKSRGLTVNEVEGYCGMRNLDEEIFRKIAENREWMRKPAVASSLVKNPRVPIGLTLPLVKFLNQRDLKVIIRDRNLADGLRITAGKILHEKRR